jgi:hypothetical protein
MSVKTMVFETIASTDSAIGAIFYKMASRVYSRGYALDGKTKGYEITCFSAMSVEAP